MIHSFLSTLIFCALISVVTAAPSLQRRQAITTISTTKRASFKPYSFYASTAYCQPAKTLTWKCGANCKANPSFEPVASGGDGSDTPFWYVGFDPTLNTVISAHEGTNTSSILSLLTDANVAFTNLDSKLFPGVPAAVQVHSGFAASQAQTAHSILAAVKSTLSTFASTSPSVTVVGHSLGAAISLLDAVYLPLHLPSGTQIKYIGYGLPRVGNQNFANYVDNHITALNGGQGLTRINNREDPIPINPGMFLGFHHPSGELHIQDSGDWDACPGQDNPSTLCIVGDVPSDVQGNLTNHDGPYNGVTMGC
ncbi:lipase [Schizopora paradoxa]|uniref:Lipase n=1 Tax=Schizopora paradoxa TaxID=27342 RepID=A0A0H2R6H2_9AGAM|nr:lipase [Schizopora paradoxa]